jgi:hypothetical protein
MTLGSITLPWTRLRKVSVRSEVLSRHAVRIYFDYSQSLPEVNFPRLFESPSHAYRRELHSHIRRSLV